ncbi:MAG TPA: hypothetical protein VHT05_11795 [Candidatus Elarobacter sp.]|nr:hypothetical protein [Candidatus Elarobacter sp.]
MTLRRSFVVTLAAAFCAAAMALAPCGALAWGAQGHRIINGAAMRALPSMLPAFLRTPAAHDEVALLGPEADRIKGAGAPLDDDDDPGHYVDVLDDLTIGGVVKLSALPKDRRAYDAALYAASPASDEYAQGYLPYSIADGWERIVRDLAYWRVDVVGEAKAATADDRAFFAFDRSVRESITLRDIGYWGHFVGDGSQPLHVSVHFNGWNGSRFGNPNAFSESRTIHSRFETALVRAVATEDQLVMRVGASRVSRDPLLVQVGAYLATTATFVPAVYRLEGAGGIDRASPEARELVLSRLAAAAAEMRDLVVEAWAASGEAKVGYPGITVRDVESGAVVPAHTNVGLGD